MELRLDLHIHSQASPDGRMTLKEIIACAKEKGLNGVAICDHDRVLPEAEARAALKTESDFLLIPGVEISTEYGHLLGWFVSRPIETRIFAEAVREIHAQGGIAVLAHPFEHSTDAERPAPLVPLLDGVEVWNSRAERKNRRANAMAATFAAEYGLRGFGGSDAHVPAEIGNGVTVITIQTDTVQADSIQADSAQANNQAGTGQAEAPTLEAVKEALLCNPANVSGRRSKAIYTAASQWTRRKKIGAAPLSYCKWALFAVKCWIEDWITGV